MNRRPRAVPLARIVSDFADACPAWSPKSLQGASFERDVARETQ